MPYKDPERQRAFQRERLARTRAVFFANKRCNYCGSTERMELDHLDPAQKTSHRIWSWSPARRAAEISKCQVLCYRCHKERTRRQQSKPLVHGTRHGYNNKGCRCDLCRAAHAAIRRESRARARAK